MKMTKHLFKLLLICFIISFEIINCSEIEREDTTESTDSSEVSDHISAEEGEDYEEYDEDQEPTSDPSFFEKFKQIHSENQNVSISLNVKHINQTFEVINNIQQKFGQFFKTDGKTGAEVLEFLSEIDVQLSAQCSASLFKIFTAVKNSEFWALKFIDSMGRFPPPGLLEGIQSSFGEFNECLDIRSPPTEDKRIDGKYCLLNVKLPYPSMQSYADGEPTPQSQSPSLMEYYGLKKLSTTKSMIETLNLSNGTIYRLGICVPSVCTPEEIEDTLNKIFSPITRAPLEVERSCHMREEKIKLDKYTWISIITLSFLTIMAIISSVVDILVHRCKDSDSESDSAQTAINSSKMLTFLLSFSLLKNMRKLLAKNERFGALDTIRLLMILHIHLGHIYQYASSIGLPALKRIFSDVMHKAFEDNSMVFARIPLPVDVLFTLSGFLLSYGLLRKLVKTNGRFNYFQFIFQRYIRFLILVFGSVLFFYLYPLTGTGPIWDEGLRKVINGCKNSSNLLNNLLFINNFNNEGNNFNAIKCHPVTWFLAALLQLTAIAPIFVIIFFKKPIVGIYTIITAIILSLLIAISPQILLGIPPYLRIWDLESIIFSNSRSMAYYHTMPIAYLVTFLVGFPFGFMLFKNVQFTKLQERVFWVLSVISILSVYLWHNSFWRLDQSAPLISILLWHTVGKLVFGMGVGWIIFACCSGRGGCFNKILSWQGFQPIARLSFGIYLLHNLVVSHRVFSVKNTYEMTFKYMLEHTFVDIFYDIILATIFYLLIESPFSNIFDSIFNPRSSHKKSNPVAIKEQMKPVSKHYSIHL